MPDIRSTSAHLARLRPDQRRAVLERLEELRDLDRMMRERGSLAEAVRR